MLLRKAVNTDIPAIWEILQQAIEQRRQDGSKQWQEGYPNLQTVEDDICKGYGYVFVEDNVAIAYAAIIFDREPAYEIIEGKWLTNDEYVVVHRVATSYSVKGRGIATHLFRMIEEVSRENKVYSIKVDTNYDNIPMLKILDRLGYTYCGEVYFRGSARKAFEKVLKKS